MMDEDVLQALRELAERLGKSELTVEDVEEHLPFSGKRSAGAGERQGRHSKPQG